jgi:hypothetical protein
VAWYDLCAASSSVLEAHESPSFSHRGVDSDFACVVQLVSPLDVEEGRVSIQELQAIPYPERFGHGPQFDAILGRGRGIVKDESNGRWRVTRKQGEGCKREVEALSWPGPVAVENEERIPEVGSAREHRLFRGPATVGLQLRAKVASRQPKRLRIDSVRYDVDAIHGDTVSLTADALDRALELATPELRAHHQPVRGREAAC